MKHIPFTPLLKQELKESRRREKKNSPEKGAGSQRVDVGQSKSMKTNTASKESGYVGTGIANKESGYVGTEIANEESGYVKTRIANEESGYVKTRIANEKRGNVRTGTNSERTRNVKSGTAGEEPRYGCQYLSALSNRKRKRSVVEAPITKEDSALVENVIQEYFA